MDTSTHHLPAGHDIHVVVIDDQPMVIEFVRRVLADDQRIQVHGFTDSAVALTEIRGPLAQVELDLVVIDLMMPGITGFDAIAAVRQLPWVGAIPILALTASDDEVAAGIALVDALEEQDGVGPSRAFDLYCLMVLNLNELCYLD
jgi:CheY-like chemotaxis protein